MKWMILPYLRYVDFSGRSRRLEYWMFTLFNILLLVGFVIIGAEFFGRADPVGGLADQQAGSGMAMVAFIFVFVFATIIPGIAVQVRRLHD